MQWNRNKSVEQTGQVTQQINVEHNLDKIGDEVGVLDLESNKPKPKCTWKSKATISYESQLRNNNE